MDFKVIIDELFNTDLYINILFSLKNVIFGFSIAFITSICLAILLNQCKIIDKIVYPVIEFLRPIPNAGWVPVAIILCSTIEESILFITFIGAFFPMFINIYRALKEIPKNYINISKLYKVNIKDKIFKITNGLSSTLLLVPLFTITPHFKHTSSLSFNLLPQFEQYIFLTSKIII